MKDFSSLVGTTTSSSSSSTITMAALPSFQRVLSIAYGGAQQTTTTEATKILSTAATATATATASTTDTILHTSSSLESAVSSYISAGGGGGTASILDIPDITPVGKSILCMASAMALHYLGYSLARPTTLSLFTSSKIGFKRSSAFPLAMAFVSPFSLLLLFVYGRELGQFGPRKALRNTTTYCAFILTFGSILIHKLQDGILAKTTQTKKILKWIIGFIFIFRESYVQLLTSQMWSFMASVLTPSQSSLWFAPISGLTSITSALAGMWVSRLSQKIGLTGVLGLAGISLFMSTLLSDKAYSISEKVSHVVLCYVMLCLIYYLNLFINSLSFFFLSIYLQYDFSPSKELQEKHDKQKKNDRNKSKNTTSPSSHHEESSMWNKATQLFSRQPTLLCLFYEILACQGLSTLLNVCFVTSLKTNIPDDSERAGWMGKFFALTNILSSMLQFGVLPHLMSRLEPSTLWRIMPLIMIGFTSIQSFISSSNKENNPSLLLKLVATSFLTMKTLEFSVRRMLDELVYVPLDFESRFVGKEVIGVFGYRFGKSGMSLLLSGMTGIFGSDFFGLKELSYLSSLASLIWFSCIMRLSNLIPTRQEAEEKYNSIHSSSKKKNNKNK